jgi:hypothetical protein
MNPNDRISVSNVMGGITQARETYKETHLNHLPGQILFDLARNESASREWRKAAVELLIDKKCPQANHAELAVLVKEIHAEREARNEVESVVETAIEEEIQSPEAHPFLSAMRASVTTKSLGLPDPIIRNASALNDDAL